MDNNKEVLLKVENLCQYFPMGRGMVNRAVNGVSFEIKKGEVFGLVGESGCGKTTTGRTIIKLYDASGGNVWLKGQRICAGTISYKKEKREAMMLYKKRVAEISSSNSPNKEEQIGKEKEILNTRIAELNAQIKAAKHDQRFCDQDYSHKKQMEVEEEFAPKLKEVEEQLAANPTDAGLIAQSKEVKAQYKEKMRIAKKERLITQIQMIFQDPISSLNPRMTVREIIAEGLRIKGLRDANEINERVDEVLEMVGLLPEHGERYQHEFSGGQRQRIGIARSIILKPELLIADEPVSALDVSIQAQVITLLNDLRDKIGLTVLFIAHDISVVKYFSDTIAVMYYGKIMEQAPSEELFAHPLHPYTKALLSAVPFPDPLYEKQRKRVIYDPRIEHNYLEDRPVMREIVPGHKIFCNEAEFKKFKKEYGLPEEE